MAAEVARLAKQLIYNLVLGAQSLGVAWPHWPPRESAIDECAAAALARLAEQARLLSFLSSRVSSLKPGFLDPLARARACWISCASEGSRLE